MYSTPYVAELAPIPRLIVDEKPPIGKKIWLITKYGNGFAGTYDKHDMTVVAWCPLPKLTDEQKQRLTEMDAPTPPEPEPENPPGCVAYVDHQTGC